MSRDTALSFIKKMISDPELNQRVRDARDVNAIINVASEAGYNFNADEWQAAANSQVLSDEDLDKISGGRGWDLSSNKKI